MLYKCKHCGRLFIDELEVMEHLKEYHGIHTPDFEEVGSDASV